MRSAAARVGLGFVASHLLVGHRRDDPKCRGKAHRRSTTENGEAGSPMLPAPRQSSPALHDRKRRGGLSNVASSEAKLTGSTTKVGRERVKLRKMGEFLPIFRDAYSSPMCSRETQKRYCSGRRFIVLACAVFLQAFAPSFGSEYRTDVHCGVHIYNKFTPGGVGS